MNPHWSKLKEMFAGDAEEASLPQEFSLQEESRSSPENFPKVPLFVHHQKAPSTSRASVASTVLDTECPYCKSREYVKRGLRQKKREKVQLYLCRNCRRTFTPQVVKGRHYPTSLVLDALSYYNLGFSLEQTCKIIRHKNGEDFKPSSLANWVREYANICTYTRMRPFGIKMYPPSDVLDSATLVHRQLYRFYYHKAKARLIIRDDFKHSKFKPLLEYLGTVAAECPHQYFNEGARASELPLAFSKKDMIVRSKENYATKLTRFVLAGVSENKKRHEALQRFLIANDSVTVATEVPIYIRKEDLAHMQTQLGFELYRKPPKRVRTGPEPAVDDFAFPLAPRPGDSAETAPLWTDKGGSAGTPPRDGERAPSSVLSVGVEGLAPLSMEELPDIITGHIDFLQIRNGMIHILDFKGEGAMKAKPIEQLTLYALALSRLTGLRVYHFKCAWFDDKHYFEFYPLHAVYKRSKGRRKRISTREGIYELNARMDKIENFSPIVK